MTNLTTWLIELNTWLEQFQPDLLEELEEPASPDLLAKLNESYAGRVPEEVLTVYAWHDGGEIPDPWWELSSIEEVLRIKKLHESISDLHLLKNWWRNAWIPVGADGNGNHLCVDLDGCFDGTPGQLIVFLHDESERKIVAPSLGAYMKALLEACRAGILICDEDEGFVTDNNLLSWETFLSSQLIGYPRSETAGE